MKAKPEVGDIIVGLPNFSPTDMNLDKDSVKFNHIRVFKEAAYQAHTTIPFSIKFQYPDIEDQIKLPPQIKWIGWSNTQNVRGWGLKAFITDFAKGKCRDLEEGEALVVTAIKEKSVLCKIINIKII